MAAFDIFLPRNQNMTQRAGFAVAAIGMILAVVLHNPFDGYTFEDHRTWTALEPRPRVCTKAEYDEGFLLKQTSNLEFEFFVRHFVSPPAPENWEKWTPEERQNFRTSRQARWALLSEKCFMEVPGSLDVTLPVSEWTSKSPLITWLGSVIHLLGVVFSVLVAVVIWLIIFQDERSDLSR